MGCVSQFVCVWESGCWWHNGLGFVELHQNSAHSLQNAANGLLIGVTALLPPRASISLSEQGGSQELSAHPHVSPFLHIAFIFSFPIFNWHRLSCSITFFVFDLSIWLVFSFISFSRALSFLSSSSTQAKQKSLQGANGQTGTKGRGRMMCGV